MPDYADTCSLADPTRCLPAQNSQLRQCASNVFKPHEADSKPKKSFMVLASGSQASKHSGTYARMAKQKDLSKLNAKLNRARQTAIRIYKRTSVLFICRDDFQADWFNVLKLGAGMVEFDDVDPERIVTYRWDADAPDSHHLFVPLATSLFNKIRGNTALRTVPIEHKDMYSFPQNLLLLLLRIAEEPTNVNKQWELSIRRAIGPLNAEMKTSIEAKDQELASRLRSLPLDAQTHILERVSIPSVESLSRLFRELPAKDTLRRLVWQEMQLLNYFSQVDRQAFRNLHLDDESLSSIVRAHSFDSKRAGGTAWYGGMTIEPISLSDELANRIVPAKLSPLADYYQDYDRLLNGHVLENRKTASVFVPKLTKLPTGWWLTSLPTWIEGDVRSLVKELFDSIHSDYITVLTVIKEKNKVGRTTALTSKASNAYFRLLHPEIDPYLGIEGRGASILARYQLARHLCEYSGIDLNQIFPQSIQDPIRVFLWLKSLSNRWSSLDHLTHEFAYQRSPRSKR
ncbi:uncharacterized protein MELLADRAFT_103389 [Melampsora larici-populina 98AG31]|uniref:Uncharacterized protein n=1 Tax=Melampsora larici-populina (strain 98AG31 / pathotype 3-4-7) TaxID=747676 RepID=F4RBB3_MELLP|nr:uncharacterized protein MELLADRAFT_103389 [Melampsora larici-populina 98AG31]EGG10055.1 hypothetical protein MELLADRAFT_103389 [Melampsora larici-populina 98AG31]